MEPPARKLHPSPQLEANFLSKLLFWWTHHIFRLGYERHIEGADIFDVPPEDSSVKLSNDLSREWEKETYRWKTGGQPSLYRALFRCYGLKVIGIGFVFLLEEAFRIGQAIFLGLLVAYFEPSSQMSGFEAYMYALGWTLTYVFVITFDNLAFHQSFYFGLKMRVGCTSLIYRKLMRLSQHSLHETNVGSIINLISSDAQKFEQSCLGINYLWIGPVETIVVLVLLWKHLALGPYSLIGAGVVGLLIPAQYFTGRYLSRLRWRLVQLVERRVRIMHELIGGIKTVKVNGWEAPFSTLISAVRSSEWRCLRRMSHCRSLNSAIYLTSGKLIMFATFVTYILLGSKTPASQLFTALALYEILRASVGLLLPWGIQYFLDALTAIKRIEKFLLLEERNILESHLQMFQGCAPLEEGTAVRLEDYTASWSRDKAAFKVESINISIQEARMVVLVGEPGSGRSSLLMAILGELPRLGGFLRTRGRLSYVPQHPWLFRGSVRDNILFGQALDNRRYNRVLHACGLLPDLENMDTGDMTLIGDKGQSLSNSQKAKICLARAAYHNADIYLIDDIFSAMDDRAAIHIFTKCFCGLLNTKTIIYVTTTLKLIRAADHIIILRQGKVSSQGTWEDLKNIGVDFRDAIGAFDSGEPEPESDERIEDGLHKNQLSLTVRRRRCVDVCNIVGTESTEDLNLDFRNHPIPEAPSEKEKAQNLVRFATYWKYLKLGTGACGFLLFATLCVLVQVLYILTDWWLFYWSKHQWPSPQMSTTSPSLFTSDGPLQEGTGVTQFNSSTPVTSTQSAANSVTDAGFSISDPEKTILGPADLHMSLFIYMGLVAAFIVVALLRAFLFSLMAVHACRKLHGGMATALLRAPVSFFEKFTPGRLLSRFSRDVMVLDDPLPASLYDCIQFLGLVVGMLLVITVANFWMLLIILPLLAVFLYTRRYYMATSRQVKHIEVSARTPIYQHLAYTLEGLWTIRAFQGEERFVRHFDVFMDRHTAAAYTYLAVSRWFAIRLDFLSVLLIGLLAVVAVAVKDSVDPGLLALAMAHALSLIGLFQYSVRQMAEVDNQMECVERAGEVMAAPREADAITELRPASPWPRYGIVTFEGVSLAVKVDTPRFVLRNMYGCIRSEEKVGVISKPSGGQRSLVSVLLRLIEPHGTVRIDGVDIGDVGLKDLRDNISVVLQDPVLFGGSVRRNLDPATRYPDSALWRVLSAVMLKDKVHRLPGNLYADLGELGTSAFSLGERQLLSLARALLRNSKIVIFEETPSILDRRTASLLHFVLRNQFSHKTVIILAHNPKFVIDMDRVMVLDDGKIKEFDSAHSLLQDKESLYFRMIHSLPEAEVRRLQKVALDKHENKPYRPPPQTGYSGSPTRETEGDQTRAPKSFLPAFQTSRLTGVLSHFTGNRFSTNRF